MVCISIVIPFFAIAYRRCLLPLLLILAGSQLWLKRHFALCHVIALSVTMKQGRGRGSSDDNLGGGIQQRLKRAKTAPPPPSELACLLIKEWSWGQISTPMVQKIAQAAKIDMGDPVHPHIDRLATLGCSGEYVGNVHRDLMDRLLNEPIFNPALSQMTLWTKIKFGQTKETSCSILLPHELFAHMYSQGPEIFERLLMNGDRSLVAKFWSRWLKLTDSGCTPSATEIIIVGCAYPSVCKAMG